MSVTSRLGLLALVAAACLVWQGHCQNLPDLENRVCRPHILTQCTNLGPNLTYNYTSFPNLRQQTNPKDIENEFLQFEQLFRYNCSNALLVLLCSVYAPFCVVTNQSRPARVLEPCRNLCEHVFDGCIGIFRVFNFSWPDALECSKFPSRSNNQDVLCFGPEDPVTIPYPGIVAANATLSIPTLPGTSGGGTTAPTTAPQQQFDCKNPEFSTRLSGLPDVGDYSLGDESPCGMPCNGRYFSETDRNKLAPAFVLVLSLLCILSTVFTVTTFLIDHLRFHYPERPIVFLCFCYLVIAIVFSIGTVSKLASNDGSTSFACSSGNKSFVFQRLPFRPGRDVSFKSGSCVTTFVFLYFFQMAAAVWWVILTFTWFLAATFKWGEEAIEKFWMVYHALGWGLPTLKVILVMSLRLVDADQLTGVCTVGNSNTAALGVFVFMPLLAYLLTGIVFLVIGFAALLNIRIQVKRDVQKAKKLEKLIIRIGVFSFLYVVPNVAVIVLYIYEMVQQTAWETALVNSACSQLDSGSCDEPNFVAFFLKYLMMLLVGITSCFWVFSVKTLFAWQKFLSDVCCCLKIFTNGAAKFGFDAKSGKESRV